MTPDTYLILGDMRFSRFEVPERINFGGEQALAVHELVGGKRIVDAMGRQDKALDWSGIFLGDNASERARYLNYLRIAGKPLPLIWEDYSCSVAIKSVSLDYQRKYEIPYSISCVVIEDATIPVSVVPPASIDSAINDDAVAATALGAQIGDPQLTASISTLTTAISSVSSFANAAQSTISGVLGPVLAVQSRIGTLISVTSNTIANIASVGGVLPNNPIAQMASRLTAQVNGYTQMPLLINLQSVVGRINTNLGTTSASNNSIVTAGGNLFALASKYYGDASAWTTLARANKLTDPALTGVQTVVIPAKSDGSGGVYGG